MMSKEENLLKWMSSFRKYDREDIDTYRKFMKSKTDYETLASNSDIEAEQFLENVGFVKKEVPARYGQVKIIYVIPAGVSLWTLYKKADIN